jgi:hypothetical protein
MRSRYVVSFQAERFYKGMRYYWMICREQNPDELVAWGHALTQELAQKEARKKVRDLSSAEHKGSTSPAKHPSIALHSSRNNGPVHG